MFHVCLCSGSCFVCVLCCVVVCCLVLWFHFLLLPSSIVLCVRARAVLCPCLLLVSVLLRFLWCCLVLFWSFGDLVVVLCAFFVLCCCVLLWFGVLVFSRLFLSRTGQVSVCDNNYPKRSTKGLNPGQAGQPFGWGAGKELWLQGRQINYSTPATN